MDTENHKFNWDDIDVGNSKFNHSQNFFAETHTSHEKQNNNHITDKQNPCNQAYISIVERELVNSVTVTNENSEDKENNQQLGNTYIDYNNDSMKNLSSSLTSSRSCANPDPNVAKHLPSQIMDEMPIKEDKLNDSYENKNQTGGNENSHEQQIINNGEEKLGNTVAVAVIVIVADENLENKENNQHCVGNNDALRKNGNSLIVSPQSSVNAVSNISKQSPSQLMAAMHIKEEKLDNSYENQNHTAGKENTHEQQHINTVQEELAKATLTNENAINEGNNQDLSSDFVNSHIIQSPDSSVGGKSDKTYLPHLQRVEWSIKKNMVIKSTGTIRKLGTASGPSTPNAYKVKDIYKKKREAYERQRLEEERKNREFHAKPVPDLNAFINKLQNRQVVHHITLPITPEVLKRSLKGEEKCKRKVEKTNHLKEQQTKSPMQSGTAEKKPLTTEPKPFKLHVLERLEKRKQYDEAFQKALDDKHKQEEEERKKREADRIKELRKATTFKARPNPFKH